MKPETRRFTVAQDVVQLLKNIQENVAQGTNACLSENTYKHLPQSLKHKHDW